MVEIDFSQEDYELVYKWPHAAKKQQLLEARKLKEKAKKSKSKVPKVSSSKPRAPKVVRTVTITPKPKPPPVPTREETYYDEDVEEFFTHRDSNNQKVDDFIDLVSSDDEPLCK